VPFVRVITDITGTLPWRRRDGGMPVGYLGRAALRIEHCDMTPESWYSGAGRDGQRLCKHVPAATNTHATIEELLNAIFSMWSLLYQMQ
jgi:hypothetical protein